MKVRIFALIAAVALACCMLAACDGDKSASSSSASSSAASSSTVSYSKDPINEYIKLEDITAIDAAVAQLPGVDDNIHVKKSDWERLIKLLASYSYTVKDNQEKALGWPNRFDIKQNGKDEISVFISKDEAIIGGVCYTVSGCKDGDFDFIYKEFLSSYQSNSSTAG